MNLLKQIKDLFIVDNCRQQPPLIANDALEALAHYCGICKRGFKTKGARGAHNAIKHKVNKPPEGVFEKAHPDIPVEEQYAQHKNPNKELQ